MKKLLFLFSILALPVFAAEEILTWGYGEQMYELLVPVGLMSGNANDPIVKLVLALGLFIFFIKNGMNGNGMDVIAIFKYIAVSLTVITLFWSSKNEYIVRDKTNNYVSPSVVQLPIGIGTTFSLFSQLEDAIAKKFEDSFSTPNSINFRNAGLGFSMSAHLGLSTDTVLTDSTYMRSFTEYMDNCYWNDVLVNNRDVGADKASPNLATALRVDAAWLTPIYSGSTSTLMSCQDAWSTLMADLPAQTSKSVEIMAKGYAMSSASYFGKVGDVAQTLFKNSGITSQQYITQMALMNAYNSSTEAVAMATGGSASNIAVAQAVTQASTKAGWAQAGIQAKNTLPIQKAFLTMISVVLLLLMALYSIALADFKGILEVFKLLFIFLMWTPLAIVINHMMYSRLENIFSGYTSMDLPNLLTSQILTNQASSYLAFLSYAVTLVTAMSFMLVSRSTTAFVQQANTAMSMGVAEGARAASTGDLSMNNTNVGNSNVRNDTRDSRSMHGQRYDATYTYGSSMKEGSSGRQFDSVNNENIHQSRSNDGLVSASFGKDGTAENVQLAGMSLSRFSQGLGQSLAQNKQSAETTLESLNVDKAKTLAKDFAMRDTSSSSSRTTQEHGITKEESVAVRKNVEESERKSFDTAMEQLEKTGMVKSVNGRVFVEGSAGAKFEFGPASVGAKAGVSGDKSYSAFMNSEASESAKAAFSKTYNESLNHEIGKRLSTNDTFRTAVEKTHSYDLTHSQNANESEGYRISQAWNKTQTEINSLSNFQNLNNEQMRDLNTAVLNRIAQNSGANTEDAKMKLWADIRHSEVVSGDGRYKDAIDTALGQELASRGINLGFSKQSVLDSIEGMDMQGAHNNLTGQVATIDDGSARLQSEKPNVHADILNPDSLKTALKSETLPSSQGVDVNIAQLKGDIGAFKVEANDKLSSNPVTNAGKAAYYTAKDFVSPNSAKKPVDKGSRDDKGRF